MIQIPSEILTLSGEPTVLCRFGKLIFANHSAEDILGSDCVGKSVKALFGTVISDAEASSFVAVVQAAVSLSQVRVTFFGEVEVAASVWVSSISGPYCWRYLSALTETSTV